MIGTENQSNEKFLSELRQAIFLNSSDWFGEHAAQVNFEQIIERRYSFLIKVGVVFENNPDRRLIIKIPSMPGLENLREIPENEKLQREARAEFEILDRIYRRIQQSGHELLAAIRVYGHLPEFCAILMEELTFELLKTSITGYRAFFIGEKQWQIFLNSVRQSAIWLRLFHENNPVGKVTQLGNTDTLLEIERAIQRLEVVSGLSQARMGEKLRTLYSKLVHTPIQQVALHNDFHLGNIFITSDQKIGSFDPNWQATGPNLIDIARILIDLETRRIQVLTFGKLLSKRRNDQFQMTFLRAYFQDENIEKKLVSFFCALELVKKWRVNEEYFDYQKLGPLNFVKPWLQNWSRHYFERVLDKYLAVGN